MRRARAPRRIVLLAAAVLGPAAGTARAEDFTILQGMYGYWSLDADDNPFYAGTFRDDGTLLHPATWQFPADWEQGKGFRPERVPGIRRQAVRLRGRERPFAFEVPLPAAAMRRLTVSLWAWLDERRDDAVLFANTALQHFGYGAFRFRVLADGITVNFGVFNPRANGAPNADDLGPSEVLATHTAFPPGRWMHVALVIDVPQAWLYLNGREIGRLRLRQAPQPAVINAVTFGDCRRRWEVDDDLMNHPEHRDPRYNWRTPLQPWSGRIDEVAMWTRPLSPAEVRGVYAATLAGRPVFDAVPVPDLWESPTFRVGIGVSAILVLGWTLHRLLTHRLRRLLSTAQARLLLDAERKRIADDIHDELGARLAKLSLLSEMAALDVRPSPDRLWAVSNTARDAARSLDELVWTLKPEQDTLADFAGYLTDAASELLEGTGIALRLDVPDDLPVVRVPPNVRRELLLVWKESMANAMKHAGATEVTVALALRDRRLTLTTADNGAGLPGPADQPRQRGSGNGLRTMRERMERLGGRCDVGPRAGGGTVVTLTLGL